MKRLIWVAAWALIAVGCDDSTVGPSPVVGPFKGELHFVPPDSREKTLRPKAIEEVHTWPETSN